MKTDEELLAMSQQMNPAQTKATINILLDDIGRSFTGNPKIVNLINEIREGIPNLKQGTSLKECCLHLMKAYNVASVGSPNKNQLFTKNAAASVSAELTKAMNGLTAPSPSIKAKTNRG